MLTVEYLPGGAPVPHRHAANVCVRVLAGALTMQAGGGVRITLRPGQSFYENPADIHVTSANASKPAFPKRPQAVRPKDTPRFEVGDRLSRFGVENLDGSSFHARDRNATHPTVLIFRSPWCASYFATTRSVVVARCRSAREQLDSLVRDGRVRMPQCNMPRNPLIVSVLRALSRDAQSQIVTRDRGIYRFPSV
jgi:hypothetical protein